MEYLKTFRSIVLDELKKREWSRKDLAQQINIDQTLINSMLRGERRFNEDQVMAIANALNMETYQLFTSETLIPESRTREMLERATEFKENYQLVEEIEPIACGNLSNISQHSIVGYKVFEKSFLRGMFKPFLTKTTGDSMFPTLSEGDLILFNRDPDKLQSPDPNRIYLVNLTPEEEEPNLTIKRAALSKEGWTLTIVPDNRMYPIETYPMSQRKSVLDYVLGVATWVGKEL
ncbi:MAG: helix-turn-helix domain-containing protein [Candidatus Aminicenantes bacterium]|nr:helix-turn-helix domain-containing protein [Candidatus Aminicenantes bacterium]NIM78293.1 helix-turn-helix domain-containing protein [Candidatus Aminicenantes bacterium]NIN19719.1 helix-turn-helix domain-containing protein [Candidatus Aminicenantes bacterium]NIN43601.1 helix-turn-helix domain-containing protein [Candidatus Aminicenantes bacterium]NIN86346.1 helix-turn-helix domain-containing protein [Candidatus Aminicenantes bacterium]